MPSDSPRRFHGDRFLGILLRCRAIGAALSLVAVSHSLAAERLRPFRVAEESAGGALRLAADLRALSALQVGAGPTLMELPLPGGGSLVARVERFEVFSPQARIVAAGPQGETSLPRPQVILLRGDVPGAQPSHVFIAIAGDGRANGMIDVGGRRYFVSTAPVSARGTAPEPMVHEASAHADGPDGVEFCGADTSRAIERARANAAALEGGSAGAPASRGQAPDGLGPRLGRLALEVDKAFCDIFGGNTTAISDYVASIIGAVNSIYLRDLHLRLSIDFLRLWPEGGEPFGADNIGGFRTYWNANEDPASYDFVHLLSGRRDMSYAGIAYLGTPCTGDFHYGISGFLNGTFSDPLGPPTLETWDVIVPAHEMGHNCGSGHTHDGYTPPIDCCACSPAVASRGSIMGYCHQHPGGTTNVDMWMHDRVEELIEGELSLGGCFEHDCNGNNIPDSTEGLADVNGNGVPDVCDDCNGNGTLDPQDELDGFADVNNNDVLDVCETDCNGNNVPDEYECDLTPAIDANGNNIPDTCEPDCNGNLVADFKEIASGALLDVDRDTVPDICQDCNGNGITDYIDLGRGENLYVADRADYVREYHRRSGYPIQNLGAGAVLDPYDVTFGADRQMYVASFGNDRVVRINPDTGASSVFVAAGAGGLDGPSSLVFGPNGNLFVASQLTNSVIQYDGATGALVGTFVTAGSGGLSAPYGLTFGPNGNLFVTSGSSVIQYDGATGALIGTFVTAGSGGLSGARGLAFKPDGNLIVASFSNNRLQQYNGATGASLGVFNNGPAATGVWGVKIGPNGNVYAVRTSTVRLMEYRASTGMYLRGFVRGDAALSTPTGFAFRPGFTNDCNANRVVDSCDPEWTDIDLFVAQLLADMPDAALVCMYDLNADGVLNGDDIAGFLGRLLP